ncbi:DivIVA domain-containing protein [Oceanirhabdus sp. W0125-5]|uniref:DivIVA domain-containing protein n=1 Tax=Oceanirhabdus sp. W0125-5 TaxID=2999116 RepID=UPI0022F33539|nr:DivIVA domain-containing protein [Oceanirhabdus sp. W0125-5]WBW95347.1 DivIVA domain-containing protein [Oceanirhabdus sp. W0125-5]
MNLSPNDINNREFRRAMRGYKRDEVEDFLADVAEDFEKLYKENGVLKDKVSMLEERLKHYKDMEETIQKTLVMAQNTAEEAKKNALRESELIIKDANETGARIIDRSKNDVIKINDEYDKLKAEFNIFRSKFRNFMNSQIDMFESLEKDFEKTYSIGVESHDNDDKTVKYEEFKKELKEINDENIDKTVAFNASEINARSKNRVDSLDNIKTFFSE